MTVLRKSAPGRSGPAERRVSRHRPCDISLYFSREEAYNSAVLFQTLGAGGLQISRKTNRGERAEYLSDNNRLPFLGAVQHPRHRLSPAAIG